MRLRSERLGLAKAPVALASETSLSNILATLSEGSPPHLVVINSIQTLWADGIDAAAGMVSQVRAATQALVHFAKARGVALLLVGHVTKDGQIAGPKVVEHIVDTVLYFEGDAAMPSAPCARRRPVRRDRRDRRLRDGGSGPARGRQSVGAVPGRAARLRHGLQPRLGRVRRHGRHAPDLVELQALVVPRASARRGEPWWDGTPAAWRCCLPCSMRAAVSASPSTTSTATWPGARITEPAADLAAAAALLSSISNLALGSHDVYSGRSASRGPSGLRAT